MLPREYKQLAWQQIKGKYGILVLIGLVYYIISTLLHLHERIIYLSGIHKTLMLDHVINYIANIITMVFNLSFAMIYLKVARNQKPKFNDLFWGFRFFWKSLGLGITSALGIMLASILFIVPGIIMAFNWIMAWYILTENSGMGIFDILNKSAEIMKGHRVEFLILELSLLIWVIPLLAGVYCSVFLAQNLSGRILGEVLGAASSIFISPYLSTVTANFYLYVKNAKKGA